MRNQIFKRDSVPPEVPKSRVMEQSSPNRTLRQESSSSTMRRNFRITSMPLSAVAALRTDVVVIGGHDNAVTLYSSSSGSALSRAQIHEDTVTCLDLSMGGGMLVSGSRDQTVRTWSVASASLRIVDASLALGLGLLLLEQEGLRNRALEFLL